MRRRSPLLTVGAPAAALALVWGFAIEPARLRNESYDVAVPHWPAGCDGIRIAVLADLHVGSPWNGLEKLRDIVALTRHAEPHLILLPGDFVITDVPGGTFTPPEEIAAELRHLSAPMGVYAVLGNHDWWFDAPRVRRALESAGIPVLDDAARPVGAGACAFWVAGFSDLWESRHAVRSTLAKIPDGVPIVAFTHNPDVFPDVPARVSLTIAGHTHGGQVYIPLLGRPIVPSRYGERYAKGLVVEGGRHLFVSSGLGTSRIPVRFLVPPEVSVVTVRAYPSR